MLGCLAGTVQVVAAQAVGLLVGRRDGADIAPRFVQRTANQFGESSGTFRAALIGLGVVLFALTIVVNMGARWVVGRAEIRLKGVV